MNPAISWSIEAAHNRLYRRRTLELVGVRWNDVKIQLIDQITLHAPFTFMND